MSEHPFPVGADAEAIERFIAALAQSLADDSFVQMTFGRYRGAQPDLSGLSVRRLVLRGEDWLSFEHRHTTRNVTTNLSPADGLEAVRAALRDGFGHAHLLTRKHDIQLAVSKKGKYLLRSGKAGHTPAAQAGHDREKHRFVDLARPFLVALGVTDLQHRLIPAMSRKWKQINKFVEIFDHALASAGLPEQSPVRVVDFGCGKAYLTFAVHDHLQHTLGRAAQVGGVELREDLVRLCSRAAQQLGLEGLAFERATCARTRRGRST